MPEESESIGEQEVLQDETGKWAEWEWMVDAQKEELEFLHGEGMLEAYVDVEEVQEVAQEVQEVFLELIVAWEEQLSAQLPPDQLNPHLLELRLSLVQAQMTPERELAIVGRPVNCQGMSVHQR